jgi:hypothetical protein
MKLPWNRSPVDDLLRSQNRGSGFLALLTAVAFTAAISAVAAHGGGDHGGLGKGDKSEKSYGGPTQTWCQVTSSCNGWDGYIAELRAHPGQDPAVPYGIFVAPAVAQYAVGARSVPYGAFAQARVTRQLAQLQPKHVRIVRRPMNITPVIAANTPPAEAPAPQRKSPSFVSMLFGSK